MPCGHRPQAQPQGHHRHETQGSATYIAKGKGIGSNGFKIALRHKRQKPAQGLARAVNAHSIGTKKPGAVAGQVSFMWQRLCGDHEITWF